MDKVLPVKFSCAKCGGPVAPRKRAGRLYEFKRGVPPLEIPADMPVPECSQCHELYISEPLAEQLEEVMRGPFIAWQAQHLDGIVDLLAARHRLNKAQIARLAGITPSYLSHLLAGEHDIASETVLRLMEAFAKCSEEVERHKAGLAFDVSAAPKSCWKQVRTRVTQQPSIRYRIEEYAGTDLVLTLSGWESPAEPPIPRLRQNARAKAGYVS
jgi:hypothetical protein